MLCERTVQERIAWCQEHLDDDEDPAQLDESYIQISVGNRKVCCELVYPNLDGRSPPQTRFSAPANADKACKVFIIGVATCPTIMNADKYQPGDDLVFHGKKDGKILLARVRGFHPRERRLRTKTAIGSRRWAIQFTRM